ncbi:MAG: hypothetical protein JWQ63_4312 [Mucilaginibacter sp.]|nr:hypothetical protein [Mucilaginibacter sp.]
MKNSLRYLKLWQKKRSELQINDDPQKDWHEMQSILDEHIPVTSAEDDKPSRSKGFKLLSLLFFSMSAAAMTYVFTYKIVTKNHSHSAYHQGHVKRHNKLNINSSSGDSVGDSLTANSVAFNKKDSLFNINQSIVIQNENIIGTIFSNKPENASSNVIPGNSLFALTKNSNPFSPRYQNVLNFQSKFQPLVAANNKNKPALEDKSTVHASFSKTKAGKSPGMGKNDTSLSRGANTGNTNVFKSRNLKGTVHHHSINGRNENSSDIKSGDNHNEYPVLFSSTPGTGFISAQNSLNITGKPILNFKIIQNQLVNKLQGNKKANTKTKNAKVKNPSSLNINIDWGLLAGVNSSGSFTPKNQNSNFYGSLPVDLFLGLFATYNINDKWAVNSQIRLFSPQTISTTYTHPNASKIDSAQSLQITSSRKIYSISIPLHAVYKVNSNLSFMAGPVINIPIKQINTNSTLQPAAIRSDSSYYQGILAVLNKTKYEQKLNFGLSGGVNIHFKRLSFGAAYMRSLSGYQVSSDFGTYKSYNGTLQFMVGFQLNKPKP